jgi:cytochrome c-type biogenesis protein CcmH/NrfF
MTRIIFVSLISLLLIAFASPSVLADDAADLTIQKRMWVIAEDLDCPVCEGQSVRESNAALAVQMRETIVLKLEAGHSEAQIMKFFSDRYGAGVLRNPPREGLALGVWIGPLIAICCGLLLVTGVLGRSKQDAAAEEPHNLSLYEQAVDELRKQPRGPDQSS